MGIDPAASPQPPSPSEPARSGRGVFRPRKGHPKDRRGTRPYAQHGLARLKTAVRALGARAIDRRSSVGRALAAWRAELVADLGGKDAVTTQQAVVIDLSVRTKLLLDSIDAWLLVQPRLVNTRKRALLPVVLQRQQLADALARYMTQLGLERRARPVPALHDYVANKYSAPGKDVAAGVVAGARDVAAEDVAEAEGRDK